ncbi:tRNA glutamyl-Q(34) synthetase GluQRS [Marilutibacter chinensis]|uniref:Glutamyl-Q tRNA(Asp) synthetase n=1 Tax=Marilutibacter chinensis TaxID=2912247 RepID=A0ABS9HPJ6_9GAMM|nr:tRNA glutamyl-Q(34) synthetase GluQRS [Lysobacter chinensis]
MPYRGRFAPSPTGDLHAGSLLAAFGSWLLARRAGGEWWVRIEDLDPPREVAGAAGRQLATLRGFGFESDAPVAFQSQRHALYQDALDRLLASGAAFECHCSRTDLAAAGGIHRRCVADSRRPQPAIRLRVADGTTITFDDRIQGPQTQEVAGTVGDFVLRRADGLWAYQLAVVVDDAAQGITDVVRGADLLDSTPRQILLQRALGLPTPTYAHLPLVTDARGRKLSKSDVAWPVHADDPLPTLRLAWDALGQDPRVLADAGDLAGLLAAARAAFAPDRIPRALPATGSAMPVAT